MATTKVDVAKASAKARAASLNETRVKLQERLTGNAPSGKKMKKTAGKKADNAKKTAVGAASGIAAFLASKVKEPLAEQGVKARDNAAEGISKGVDNGVVPAAQSGVNSLGNANDTLHSAIESLLNSLSQKIDDIPARKDDLLAATPLLKDAPAAKKSSKGGMLITLGLLALAGAGAAYYMAQRNTSNDPWAVSDEELQYADGYVPEEPYAPAVTTTHETYAPVPATDQSTNRDLPDPYATPGTVPGDIATEHLEATEPAITDNVLMDSSRDVAETAQAENRPINPIH